MNEFEVGLPGQGLGGEVLGHGKYGGVLGGVSEHIVPVPPITSRASLSDNVSISLFFDSTESSVIFISLMPIVVSACTCELIFTILQ